MDQSDVSVPQNNLSNQELPTVNSSHQIDNDKINVNNNNRNKLFLIIGILVVVIIVALGGYYFSLNSNKDVIKPPITTTPILEDKTNPEEGKYIIFQDKKVALGYFKFLSKR